eukprot:4029324-Amphidinium_carterae.1
MELVAPMITTNFVFGNPWGRGGSTKSYNSSDCRLLVSGRFWELSGRALRGVSTLYATVAV